MGELLQFPLTILGGAIGSGITLWLNSRQFRAQRWWDKKADTYLSIIDAFHSLLDEDDVHWDAVFRGAEIPEERQKELRDKAAASTAEIQRRQRLGRFLISDEAESALKKMQNKLEVAGREVDWNRFREETSAALVEGFDGIKRAGASDLGVTPFSPRRTWSAISQQWLRQRADK